MLYFTSFLTHLNLHQGVYVFAGTGWFETLLKLKMNVTEVFFQKMSNSDIKNKLLDIRLVYWGNGGAWWWSVLSECQPSLSKIIGLTVQGNNTVQLERS